jgi:hypothetical protein
MHSKICIYVLIADSYRWIGKNMVEGMESIVYG